jgi:membrane protein
MNTGTVVALWKQTFTDWSEDKAPRLGAALAYYAIFSIPPLILLVIAAVGLFYKGDVAGAIQQQLGGLIGEDTARTIMEVRQQQDTDRGILAGIFGIVLLLFGASGVFGQLQDAMNTIWEVKPKESRGIMGMIKDRFLSFAMILGIAFLLLVSLVLSAAVAAIGDWVPGGEAVGHILELGISFAVVTLLFAMIFKMLPDVKIAWNDVWLGAAATAVLFTMGKFLLGLYLGKGTVASAYGAAGSVIIMIVWVYYSAQILFLGAEFTQVYANRFGSRVVPAENAEPVTEKQRAEEGLTAEKGKPTSVAHRVPATVSAPPVTQSPAPASYGLTAIVALGLGFIVGRRHHGDPTSKAA